MCAFEEFYPATIVLDIVMPGVDGIALVQCLKTRDCSAKALAASASNPKYVKFAEQIGLGLDISRISKPFALDELCEALS